MNEISILAESLSSRKSLAGIPTNHMTVDEYIAFRGIGEQYARTEYNELVSAGVIVPKSPIEIAITNAHNDPDLQSTQEARKMVKEHGIDWETGFSLNLALLSDADLELLWELFDDVPLTEGEDGLYLARDWHKYPAGLEQRDMMHDIDKYHSKGAEYLLYEKDDTPPIDCSDYSFYLFRDLTHIHDSMQFDSYNTTVAEIAKDGLVIATIEVIGDVRVDYKGTPYRSYCEFPQELKELIDNDKNWFDNPDVHIIDNNWFEFFATDSESSISVDVEELSLPDVYKCMAECFNSITDMRLLPESYIDFVASSGTVIDFTKHDRDKNISGIFSHDSPLSYYIPELDINGTAEDLFIEVRNGYCDNQPEKIAKIAELIENEAQFNNDSELAKKAVIVHAAHELAVSDKSNPLNIAQMKYDILANDKIFDVDGIPLDDSGSVVLTVWCERDTVLFSVYDVYKEGNEVVTATGGASIPIEQFLKYSQSDFDATVGSIIANNMIELDRTPVQEEPKRKKDTISRDE